MGSADKERAYAHYGAIAASIQREFDRAHSFWAWAVRHQLTVDTRGLVRR